MSEFRYIKSRECYERGSAYYHYNAQWELQFYSYSTRIFGAVVGIEKLIFVNGFFSVTTRKHQGWLYDLVENSNYITVNDTTNLDTASKEDIVISLKDEKEIAKGRGQVNERRKGRLQEILNYNLF